MKTIAITCSIWLILTLAVSGQVENSRDYKRPTPEFELVSMKDEVPDDPCEVGSTLMSIAKEYAKSEFETEKQYLERIAKTLATTKIKSTGRSLAQIVFFFRDLAKYDAESQMFRFELSSPAIIGSKSNSRRCVTVYGEREAGKWQREYLGSQYKPDFKMAAEQAEKVKPALVLAMYGYPVDLYLHGKEFVEIVVVPTRLVTFNQLTGEIYSDVESVTWKERLRRVDEWQKKEFEQRRRDLHLIQ